MKQRIILNSLLSISIAWLLIVLFGGLIDIQFIQNIFRGIPFDSLDTSSMIVLFVASLGFVIILIEYMRMEDSRHLLQKDASDTHSQKDMVFNHGDQSLSALSINSLSLENFLNRPRYSGLSKVANGYYLEITSEEEATNRVVEVENERLPQTLDVLNKFIEISEEERKQFDLSYLDLTEFEKFTPGSYKDPSYYIEVDLNNKPVNNVKYTKKRLPPTTTKGHRWIRIEPRKIT